MGHAQDGNMVIGCDTIATDGTLKKNAGEQLVAVPLRYQSMAVLWWSVAVYTSVLAEYPSAMMRHFQPAWKKEYGLA